MSKAIVKDGKTYRMRRGKLVEIPAVWVGKFPTKKTINERPSKSIHKRRKEIKHGSWNTKRSTMKDEHNLVDSLAEVPYNEGTQPQENS